MNKTFVIAGTNHEAQYWIKKDIERRAIMREVVSITDYHYVSKADDLRGVQNPHGVFVGNWLGRPDIFEIVQALMLASTHVNPALGKIYKDLKPKVRPTPKLKQLKPNQRIDVYMNGILQDPSDYSVQNDTIILTNPDDYDTDVTITNMQNQQIMYHQIILKPRATISLPI